MTQEKELCFDEHICRRCKSICFCGTYTWVCPWRNEDEDDVCGACLTEIEKEMYEHEMHTRGTL